MNRFRQNLLTQLPLQGIGCHQIDWMMQTPLQVFLKREELELPTGLPGFEFHQEIHVAIWPGLIACHRTKHSDVLHGITGPKLGKSLPQYCHYLFTPHGQDSSLQHKGKPRKSWAFPISGPPGPEPSWNFKLSSYSASLPRPPCRHPVR